MRRETTKPKISGIARFDATELHQKRAPRYLRLWQRMMLACDEDAEEKKLGKYRKDRVCPCSPKRW
jgi:hypothetical protein